MPSEVASLLDQMADGVDLLARISVIEGPSSEAGMLARGAAQQMTHAAEHLHELRRRVPPRQ